MKILVVSDYENPGLWEYWREEKTEGIDLIISCGDLNHNYLEFLTTVINKPLLYVRGNHDTSYDKKPPEGCIDIDDQVYTYKGIRFLGLGGSMRYRTGDDMYSEEEMQKRIKNMRKIIKKSNGFDFLVTHSPALGYGDRNDIAHTGFACFNDLIEEYKPMYMLYGHVHQDYGDFKRIIKHENGCMLVNCYDRYVIEIDDERIREENMRNTSSWKFWKK